MSSQRGFWDVDHRLEDLSAQGDPLEKLAATVDFEMFRPALEEALGLDKRIKSNGGRPGFDAVLKFKMLVLQIMHGLSLDQAEFLLRDRLSWMRFCGVGPGDRTPDAKTLWEFREKLVQAEALDRLFTQLDRAISEAGFIPMGGQIVDATLVSAPKQRNTDEEKAAIKAGKSADEIWENKAKARQKDVDARWTVKFAKGRPDSRGEPRLDIAIPTFGYKSHISIDQAHGFICCGKTTSAAAHDGARLREGLIDPNNTASSVWADSAYRSAENEAYLKKLGLRSCIHRRKPKGKPMAKNTARANAKKSEVRAHVEHPFAAQKSGLMALTIRTIGQDRAAAIITVANMIYNMRRWVWWEARTT